jgi:hypothetical protein
MTREVVAPDGSSWRIRRRWLLGRPRVNWRAAYRKTRGGFELLDIVGPFADLPMGGGIGAVLAAVLAPVIIVLVLLILIGTGLLLVDVVLLLGALVLGGALRWFGRIPWPVVADSSTGDRYVEYIAGRANAAALVDDLANRLEAGVAPPR